MDKYSVLNKKINTYLKYSLAAAQSFNILGLTPNLEELKKLVYSKFMDPIEACYLAQKRFNQMVAPYLGMKEVNLNPYVLGDFRDFLHDLIHEGLKEGSVAKFIETDASPPSPTNYSLQDYIDEDIAQFLSSEKKLTNGLAAYVDNLPGRISETIASKQDLAKEVNKILTQDIESIKNNEQKKFLIEFKKSFIFQILNSKEKLEDILYSLIPFTEEYMNKAYNLSIIDNELIASLLRRWLMQVKKDLENTSIEIKM